MRIGYYLSFPFKATAGGVNRHVLTLMDHLDRKGCDLTAFCHFSQGFSAAAGPFFAQLRERGVSLRLIGGEERGQIAPQTREKAFRRLWTRAMRLLKLHFPPLRAELAAANLDVIHFHCGAPGFLYWPIIASLLARIPTRILTVHNSVRRRPYPVRAIEGLVLRSLHRIIVPSEHIKAALVANKRVIPQRVTVIPHGFDLPPQGSALDRSEARKELRLSHGIPVAGMVARLAHVKGQDLLIRAVPRVRARVPDVKIVLIGDGPEKGALQKLAQEQGVSDITLFMGYRGDAARLMPALDVLIAPSRDEGLSLSILEAMFCGRPVIAANVGGTESLVITGVTGLLIPPEDPIALGEAVIRLLTNPKEAEEMGKAGKERARVRFSLQTMLDKTLSLYDGPSPL